MSKAALARILVIDDTESNRYTVCRYLRNAGYAVWEAGTGEEGLRLALNKPDMVVLDVKLPDILGFDVCRRLKSDPRTAHIPVMHISATFTLTTAKVRGLEGGADAYLTGPIEGQELVANVKALLRMRDAETNAQKHLERFRFVLSSITEAYYALDDQNRFVEVNRAAEEIMFRRSEAELKGKIIWEEFPEGLESDFPRHIRRVRESKQPAHFEAQSHISERWFEAHVYPRDGLVEVYLHDITQRKSSEQALKTSQEQLQQLNRELEQRVSERTAKLKDTLSELEAFSYTVSHDMRAPLRAMQGFAQMLQEDCGEKLSATACDYLQRIFQSANRLDQMIRDVLALSRVSRADTHLDWIGVERLVADIVRQNPEFERAQADVAVVTPIPKVHASLPLLSQILNNLLGNAVKFVAPGVKPVVRVRGIAEAGVIRLAIEDNGIGIAPEHKERIFKLFERVHSGKGYSGTGLGLSIVRKAVERMGGRVWVESVLGEGSTFWVELPATPKESPEAAEEPGSTPRPERRPKPCR